MKKCELCDSSAKMYCESDQASLCWDCDAMVHGANFLVAKHSRTLLCHLCQSLTPWNGCGPRLGPTVSVCESCVNNSSNCRQATGNIDRDAGDDDDDLDREDDSSDDDDDGDDNGDGDDDGGDEDDEENQVVPWYSMPPPQVSSSSNSDEYCSSRFSDRSDGAPASQSRAPVSLNRMRQTSSPSEPISQQSIMSELISWEITKGRPWFLKEERQGYENNPNVSTSSESDSMGSLSPLKDQNRSVGDGI